MNLIVSEEQVKERIKANENCIDEFIEFKNKISDLELKIQLIELIGCFYGEYVTGIYASEELENELVEIANSFEYFRNVNFDSDKILVIMTSAYIIGGHAVVVNNWIQWDSNHSYSLVFTNMDDKEAVPEYLLNTIEENGGEVFFLKGTFIDKAIELRNIAQKYFRILLFQHMYDVIPNLAFGHYNWDVPVYLYNHANYKFSFGYCISDVILNLNEYDLNKTCYYRGVKREKCLELQFPELGTIINSAAPINLAKSRNENRKAVFEKYNIEPGTKLIVSMGADYKYKKIVGCDFAEYAEKVVNGPIKKIKFLIIGADKRKERWKDLYNKTSGKIEALGELKRDLTMEIISSADLYIVSFPMNSSGASDADNAGVPFLCLDLIGRFFQGNKVTNIEDLLQKTYEILTNNENEFVNNTTGKEYRWEKKKWCNVWNDILFQFNRHHPMTITPNKMVGKEEIINCQLIQEVSNITMNTYLSSHYYPVNIIKKIIDITEKWDMGVYLSKYILLDEKKDILKKAKKNYDLYRKCDKLYIYSEKWISLYIKGIRISDYLNSKGYKNIVIYGFSKMGENLLGELKNSNINIISIIDKYKFNINCKYGIDIKYNFDETQIVDVIINTTAFTNETIMQEFVCDVPMISLLDVIDELIELLE